MAATKSKRWFRRETSASRKVKSPALDLRHYSPGRLCRLGMRGMADWRRTECVLTGSGEEVVSKLIVEHQDAAAAGMFVREQFAAISAMAPGTSVSFGVQVQPCMALTSFLIPKAEVAATIDGVPFTGRDVDGFSPAMIVRPKILPGMNARLDGVEGSQLPAPRSGVQLTVLDLAFTRSGEKGETINIAVIARKPEYLPTLRATLAPHRIQSWFADLGKFDVAIHEVPGINALHRARRSPSRRHQRQPTSRSCG